MNQDINFLRDTFLFEEFEKSCFPKPLNKQAGLYEDLGLDSVGNFIKDFAKKYFKDSSEVPGGYFTSLLNIMAPAVLFRINPFLSALYGLFSLFGFSLSDIITKIAEVLEPKLSKGEPVTPQEVNSAAAAAVGAVSDISNASDSFFISAAKDGTLSQYTFEYFIKQASYLQEKDKYKLRKKADFFDFLDPDKEREIKQRRSEYGKRKIPFLSGGGKDVKILQRIFGNLWTGRPDGASRIKWFGVGFAVWILKTVLAGAGLLVVGGIAAKMLGLDSDSKKEESQTPEAKEKEEAEKKEPEETEDKEKSTSKPTSTPTSSNNVWLVPLVGDGSIQDTIRIWVLDLYPDLNQYPDINNAIYSSPKFQRLIDELSSDLSKIGTKYLQMPSRYSSRKQVVNEFIDEIRRKINVP